MTYTCIMIIMETLLLVVLTSHSRNKFKSYQSYTRITWVGTNYALYLKCKIVFLFNTQDNKKRHIDSSLHSIFILLVLGFFLSTLYTHRKTRRIKNHGSLLSVCCCTQITWEHWSPLVLQEIVNWIPSGVEEPHPIIKMGVEVQS